MAGSLLCVGVGIQFGSHASEGAKRAIAAADKVLYLAADHATAAWIEDLSAVAESLHGFYALGKPRIHAYEQIVDHILSHVRAGKRVCVVTYGHPGVFAYATHEAIRRARAEGFEARMLPAISSIDCLIADLGVDPGMRGFQCYEATDFVARRRIFDPASPLVLLQVGLVGDPTHQSTYPLDGLPILIDLLAQTYGDDHEVVVYEAARFPVCAPSIQRMPLSKLTRARFSAASTLYVPPGVKAELDGEMLQRLKHSRGALAGAPTHSQQS